MTKREASGLRLRPEQARELLALLLLGFSLFALLATLSFRYGYGSHRGGNLCGSFGYELAFACIFWFGAASYVLFSVLSAWGLLLFSQRGAQGWIPKAVGLVALTVGLAIVLEHHHSLRSPDGTTSASFSLPTGWGGVLGYWLAPFLADGFGRVGTYLVLGLLLCIATLLATDFVFYPAVVGALGRLRSWSSDRAKAKRGGPAPGRKRQGSKRRGRDSGEDALVPLWTARAGSFFTGLAERFASWRDALAERFAAWKEARAERRAAAEAAFAAEVALAESEIELAPAPRRRTRPARSEEPQPRATEPEEEVEPAPRPTPRTLPPEVAVEETPPRYVEPPSPEPEEAVPSNVPESAPPRPRTPAPPPRKRSSDDLSTPELPFPQPAYSLPPLSDLERPSTTQDEMHRAELRENAMTLEQSLKSFRIEAKVVHMTRGPVVAMYELELEPGTKVARITALSDDLAIALKAPSVRVVAPIPGKSTVGIEVPNSVREVVRLAELYSEDHLDVSRIGLPLFLGKDVGGNDLVADLAKMPHLLIAGATGSGKSVCINTIIASILLTRSPSDVKLILIDPKMVELQAFQRVPHIICPVVTNMRRAPGVLDWAVNEMESRYELLSQTGVRHIKDYNQLGREELQARLEEAFSDETPLHLPYIVVVVDELADLMMQAAKEVETSITWLAQKSRAVGIHVILATQRPSTNVITGLIKANMPARIAFQVASKIDSRVILDYNGAETLLGGGDMLYSAPAAGASLVRAQGTYVSDAEIRRMVSHLCKVAQPTFVPELIGAKPTKGGGDEEDEDDLYEEAVRIILKSQRGSASLLQRALGIGYTRASRLIDLMTAEGLVGEYKGSKAREVMMSLEEWEEMRGNMVQEDET